MHSSVMRTARLLTVSKHALGWGGCIPACTGQGGVCMGGVCPGGGSAQGVSAWGVSARGGVLPRGCLPRGVADTRCEQND